MRIEKLLTPTALLASSAVLLVSVAACAATGNTTRNSAAPIHDDCMFAASLRDWRPLDDTHLLLFGPGHTAYLVELERRAVSLSFNVNIGVYDRDGNICPYGGDSILVRGPVPDRIPIRSMQWLDAAELDDIYVRFGVKAPPVMKTEPVEKAAGSK